MERSFENGTIKAYESVEWQAKALCGEFMMPYDETIDMTLNDIVKNYGVSLEQAKYRKKY
ncbi:MAG: ImmA/IrrE family metallo-endopeptidase [Bacillota bacterium]|nr:ImmA/IrrE family metallo-endopeptidase [Bacillota bacterium]